MFKRSHIHTLNVYVHCVYPFLVTIHMIISPPIDRRIQRLNMQTDTHKIKTDTWDASHDLNEDPVHLSRVMLI